VTRATAIRPGPAGRRIPRARGRCIRVMLVDDSFPYRMFLRELIDAQADMEVVAESGDGMSAAQRVAEVAPDVVLMDVAMPGIDGIEATRRIVASGICAKVIVVSAFQEPDAMKRVLKAGVVTSFRKDRDGNAAWNAQLLAGIRKVAGVAPAPAPAPGESVRRAPGPVRAVVIGASTGGPQAVARVLSGLPEDIGVPVLVVLHVAEHFGPTVSEWMAKVSGRPVHLARDGEPLAKCGIRLAPADVHMTVEGGRVVLSHAPPRHSVRPSVDVLFESAAREFGPDVVGVLLTGMGRDGAQGLLALREEGAVTLAQDEATSAVFGMPAEAIRMGAAEQVLPLERIPVAILHHLARNREGGGGAGP
jgi:two-component system chemotaxis response regulator CheB